MTAQGIRAGNAYVEVGADLNPLDAALKKIEGKFKSIGTGVSSFGKGLAGVGAVVAGIGTTALGGLTALSARFASVGDVLSKTSDRTGITASVLSELGYAAEQSGTDLGTVEKSISKMQKGITGAVGGSKSLSASFNSIGLSAEYLAKLDPQRQFEEVASAIGKIQDPTQRAAKAMEIFGKSGTQLLPLLISDIEALRKEARDLGLTISDEDAKNATNLGDSFDRVRKSLGGISTQIGAALAVPLTIIANTIASVVGKVSQWVAANRGIAQTVAAIAAGFVVVGTIAAALGVAIIGVGATISAIGTVIGSVVGIATAAFATISAAIGAILSPVGLVVAAVVGIGAYVAYVALSSTGALSKLSEMFGSLGGVVTETWGGIVAALSTGDLETAGQIAFTALEIGWLTVTNTMQDVWNRVSDFFVNTWLSVVESIVQAGASIYFGVAKYFDQLSNALVAGFDIGITYITGAIDGIQTAIAKAIIKAQEFFGFFSKDQSVQIQASLDEDLKRNAANRQKGLDTRASERGTALEQRAQQRQATAEQFSTIVSEDFARRQSKTDSSPLAAAQKRLEELKLSLTEKATAAQEKAAQGQAVANVERGQQAAMMMQTSGGSSGSFLGGIAASIQGGGVSPLEDLNKQQLDVLGSIDGRLRNIDDAGGLE